MFAANVSRQQNVRRDVQFPIRFPRAARRWIEIVGVLRRDQLGNFTVMFAMSATFLIIFVGMGVDFSVGLSLKSRWDTASDAGVMAAIAAAEAYVEANSASQTGSVLISGAIAAGEAQGLKVFNANAGASEMIESVTPTVALTISGTTFTATVTYTSTVGTHFGALVGIPTLAVQGKSVGTANLTTYINYYILVDISQSMGIGSTPTDQTNLFSLTKTMGYTDDGDAGCVFGCHVATSGRPYSNEQLAHEVANPPITLRIDSAKTAIQNVITQAQNITGGTGNVKIGLYTLQLNSNSPTYKYNTISSPTANYKALSTLANTIDLGPNTTGGLGDSDMTDGFSQLVSDNVVPPQGNGFSPSSPLNYILLITDGVMDISGPCNADGHCTGAIPTNACSALQQNATIGVVYTTYLPIYENNNSADGYEAAYSALVLPFSSSIEPNLEACASAATLFFEASDGSSLISSLQSLFISTLVGARLMQ